MQANTFYQPLDIGIDQILTDPNRLFQEVEHHVNRTRPFVVPLTDISREFKEFCQRYDVELKEVVLLCTNANTPRFSIHIDEPGPGDWGRLNWVYGDNNADMVWYQLLPDWELETIPKSWGEKLHYFASDYAVEECCRTQINANPTIVKTGCLHNIYNHSGNNRFVVQAVLTKNNEYLTVDQLKDIFQEYLT